MVARAKVYTAQNRTRLRAHILSVKQSAVCKDCEKSYPTYVLDFDHVKGEKNGEVSVMVRRSVSIETLKSEIAKCELVCANCHRVRTHRRSAGLINFDEVAL